MRFNINLITPRQKLIIQKGIWDYLYIMNHWMDNDSNFEDIYYDFYLKARWAVMSKPQNKNPYFRKLQSITPQTPLMEIIKDLKAEMENGSNEFSLCTKLLHTRNPLVPIYDSKVRVYLSRDEGVKLWWQCSGAPRGMTEEDKIEHDWNVICEWYNIFLEKEDAWISWFNKNIEGAEKISDYKKIDFIIFATTDIGKRGK